MTNELERRMCEHKGKVVPGFTKRYNVTKLVHWEEYDTYQEAFEKEKAMKRWRRTWKNELIEKNNPDWIDLSRDWD